MDPNNPNPNPAPSGTPTPPAQPTQGVSIEQFNALQDTVKQMSSFVEDASFIIGQVYSDPNLRAGLQNKLGQNGNGNPPQNPQPAPPQNDNQKYIDAGYKFHPVTGQPLDQQTPPANPNPAPQNNGGPNKVEDMEMKMREDIVARVEQKYGYGNLAPEQRKQLRRSVEKRLNGWGGSVLSSPVNQLTTLLEDAYVLEDLPKAKEEGRIEGLVQARQNDMGALPAMGNQQPAPETTQLSGKQKELSQKWGLDQNKVTERLKEFQETGVMTYKPPTPAGSQPAQPAPSGNPQPPAPQPPAAS